MLSPSFRDWPRIQPSSQSARPDWTSIATSSRERSRSVRFSRIFNWLSDTEDCPVIVHVRDAFCEAARRLRDYQGAGVIHCYTGGPSELAGFLERGLHISFSGVITYGSGQKVREAAKIVPADRILVETDCPYLSPGPERRKRNEPAYVVRVVERMAQVRDETTDEIASLTYRNASRLFRLDDLP